LTKKRKTIDIRKRKPKCLTFVRHKCDDKLCHKELTKRMIAISKIVKAKEMREIILEKDISETLRNKGVPELWLHDFQNSECPLQPFQDYYIIDFDDGSKKIYLMLKDFDGPELEKDTPEIMYA